MIGVIVVAPAAAADIPFADGPGSARKMQQAFAKDNSFQEPRCRYVSPLIRCTYYTRLKRSDTYVKATLTIHKTTPKMGWALECWPLLGVCDRKPMPMRSAP